MTGVDHPPGQPDCGGDVAAYVLGALEPAEANALREHLQSCSACRNELASLQEVADALPLATSQLAPPRALKRRVMREVRRQAEPAPAGALVSLRRSFSGRAAGALAGAVALAAIVAVLLATSGSPGTGTRLVQARVTPPGATAVLRANGAQAALTVRNMPQPPAGKVYQVWLQRGQAPPAPTDALFGVTSSGSAAVAIPGDLHGVSAVLVTPEPRGGSLSPTHAPVIEARL